jgi:AsmA-like C-terminal region
LLLLVVGLELARPAIAKFIRTRTQDALADRYKSGVEFSDFQVSFSPRFTITIKDLKLRHHARSDVPPLIQMSELNMIPSVSSLFGQKVRISKVQLVGLQITFPPREPGSPPMLRGTDTDLKNKYPVLFEKFVADDAKLILLRAQPEKPPLEFPLHHLELHDLSFDGPARFSATLTNTVPKGEIEASGTFGPWNGETPRSTPVNGKYRFEHADLSTIKGLQGILSSIGTFDGPLDYLSVKGTTDIPDFTLRRVANPVALHTDFSATVDGTNGNTYLHSVQASFLQTTLLTHGEVVDRNREMKGRTIELDTSSDHARVEDLLHLAAKTKTPVLKGPAQLKAHIHIPEEDVDLSDRLEVTSQFHMAKGQFTNPAIQDKVDSLSRRGQGQPKDTDIAHVQSELTGAFHLQKGIIQFTDLRFEVPGAKVNLQGTYALAGDLDFHGHLLLDAKLSQTMTGWKSLVLKAIDPLFSGKNVGAGTDLPIKVTGTKEHPEFGLDRGGKKSSHDQPAGAK